MANKLLCIVVNLLHIPLDFLDFLSLVCMRLTWCFDDLAGSNSYLRPLQPEDRLKGALLFSFLADGLYDIKNTLDDWLTDCYPDEH